LKHFTQTANQYAMRALRWMPMLLGFWVVAAFAAEKTSPLGMGHTSKAGQQPALDIELTQRLPFERNKIESIDPAAAFVEGYHAYEHRDLIATIGRMRFAASQLPNLADYALFYLASAERDSGDSQSAANDFRRLTLSYPQSTWSDDADLEYARLELKLGHPDYALSAATEVVNTTRDGVLEQNARLTIAQALLATDSWRSAYNQAQIIRQKFPTGPADAAARRLAYATLQSHPQVLSEPPLEYHRNEAALLLRESQNGAALNQIRAAMALLPPRAIQAELRWLSAQAARGQPDRMKPELLLYLELAPRGPLAARALNGLAHLYWHENDTRAARLYFRRLPLEFPRDELAPEAMFEIGRTYEEDGNLQAARLAYLDLVGAILGRKRPMMVGSVPASCFICLGATGKPPPSSATHVRMLPHLRHATCLPIGKRARRRVAARDLKHGGFSTRWHLAQAVIITRHWLRGE
jgi:hypothetical protein